MNYVDPDFDNGNILSEPIYAWGVDVTAQIEAQRAEIVKQSELLSQAECDRLWAAVMAVSIGT